MQTTKLPADSHRANLIALNGADCYQVARRADSMMDHGGERNEEYERKLKALRNAAFELANFLRCN